MLAHSMNFKVELFEFAHSSKKAMKSFSKLLWMSASVVGSFFSYPKLFKHKAPGEKEEVPWHPPPSYHFHF